MPRERRRRPACHLLATPNWTIALDQQAAVACTLAELGHQSAVDGVAGLPRACRRWSDCETVLHCGCDHGLRPPRQVRERPLVCAAVLAGGHGRVARLAFNARRWRWAWPVAAAGWGCGATALTYNPRPGGARCPPLLTLVPITASTPIQAQPDCRRRHRPAESAALRRGRCGVRHLPPAAGRNLAGPHSQPPATTNVRDAPTFARAMRIQPWACRPERPPFAPPTDPDFVGAIHRLQLI